MNGKILLITEDNLEAVSCQKSAIIAENCLFELDAPIMRLQDQMFFNAIFS